MPPLSLNGRLRWLRVRVTLAEWFVPRIPQTAPVFEALLAEAEALMEDTTENVRRCEEALHDR